MKKLICKLLLPKLIANCTQTVGQSLDFTRGGLVETE